MILCSATTQTITFAPPGFSTSTCIGGSNYTGSTQMSFVLKGECSDNKCLTPTPTPSVTPTISLTPTITPTKTVTPSSSSVSLKTYYGIWSRNEPLGGLICSATLRALVISTASTLSLGVVVSNLDGTPINNLKIIWSDIDDTYNSSTNSSSVVSTISGCGSVPTPTVCSSNQFQITNNTGSPITVDNVTNPFNNNILPQFTLSANTALIVCSCTTPTSSGGIISNNGVCPYL
jgi:hypothetical protein